jgi:hypothetical protein
MEWIRNELGRFKLDLGLGGVEGRSIQDFNFLNYC